MLKVKACEGHELKALKAQRLQIYIKSIVLLLAIARNKRTKLS
jgi:hypothetical protein